MKQIGIIGFIGMVLAWVGFYFWQTSWASHPWWGGMMSRTPLFLYDDALFSTRIN